MSHDTVLHMLAQEHSHPMLFPGEDSDGNGSNDKLMEFDWNAHLHIFPIFSFHTHDSLNVSTRGGNPVDPCDPHTPGSQGHHNLVCFPWQITGIMHCGPCSCPWPLPLKPIRAAWDWVAKHKWIVSCVWTLTCHLRRTWCHADTDKLRSKGDHRVTEEA